MKLPQNFYKPLAIGAPSPFRELPLRPERVVHFFPPHNEKIRARLTETARQVDVLCGNLEDAIPIESKAVAREGFIEGVRQADLGDTALWVRVNCLNSPWVLDDLAQIVAGVGNRLDAVMIPKVEGPWDIHFVDQYLALLEVRFGIEKPILIHALLETAEGVKNIESIVSASPRMHGLSLGPADLAASRRMKTTRVGGGYPFYGVLADPDASGTARSFVQQDLWHYTIARGRRLRRQRHPRVLRTFRRPQRRGGLRGPIPQRLHHGLHRSVVARPEPDCDREARVQSRRTRGAVCQAYSRVDARRHRRGDDRRQDAGRRHLEAG